MPSQGPNNGSVFLDDATIGTAIWTTPEKAQVSDNDYATSNVVSFQITHYLIAKGFGFSIPLGAVIDGIVATVERKYSGIGIGTCDDNSVRLLKAGVFVGEDKQPNDPIGTTDTENSDGSPTDLWQTTWTPAEINDSGFGFGYSAHGNDDIDITKRITVDHMTLTVYYHMPPTLFPFWNFTS